MLGPAQEALRLDEEFRETQIARMGDGARCDEQEPRDHAREPAEPRDHRADHGPAHAARSQRRRVEGARGSASGQIDEVNAFKVTAFVDEFYLTRVDDRAARYGRHRRQDLRARGQQGLPGASRIGNSRSTSRSKAIRRRCDSARSNGAHAARDRPAGRHARACQRRVLRRHRRAVGVRRRPSRATSRSAARSASAAAIRRVSRCSKGSRDGERVITSSYENLQNFDRIQFSQGLLSGCARANDVGEPGEHDDQAERRQQALPHHRARNDGARRHRLRARRRRVRRGDGPLGLRQVDAAQHRRAHRRADERPVLLRRPGSRRSTRRTSSRICARATSVSSSRAST